MEKSKQENILIGACKVYMQTFEGTEIPSHKEIETEENRVAHTSGGTTIEYMPEKYEVRNDFGQIVKTVLRQEDLSVKFGMLYWDMKTLKSLSAAKLVEGDYDASGKWTEKTGGTVEKLVFGGRGVLPNVLLRLVHEKDNGAKIRFTCIGQGGDGFSIDFGEEEVVVDSVFQAVQYLDNFFAELENETKPSVVEPAGYTKKD